MTIIAPLRMHPIGGNTDLRRGFAAPPRSRGPRGSSRAWAARQGRHVTWSWDGNDRSRVKVLAWYDGEWGYSNRLVELAQKVLVEQPALV